MEGRAASGPDLGPARVMPTMADRPSRGRGPALSVILVAGIHRDRARRALESVLTQECDGGLEILLVELEGRSKGAPMEVEDARVRRISVPATTTFGAARAEGVRHASAPVVAFLEEHCVAQAGWARAILQAHAAGWSCVGGEVHNLNPGEGWSDAVYFMGYAAWMPPARRGPAAMAVAHNSSYNRDDLASFGDHLPDLLNAEPILQWALRARGAGIYIEPAARFWHLNETSLPSLKGFFWWNRCFARTRSSFYGWGLGRKVLDLLSSPLRPWVRLLRQFAFFLRGRPDAFWRFILLSPRIFVLHSIAVLGHGSGVLWGSETDERRFTEHELSDPRSR